MKKTLITILITTSMNVFAQSEDSTFIDPARAASTLIRLQDYPHLMISNKINVTPEGSVIQSASYSARVRKLSKNYNVTYYGVCLYKKGAPAVVVANPLTNAVICPANSYFLNIYTTEELILNN